MEQKLFTPRSGGAGRMTWIQLTLETAVCRDCGSAALFSIEDRFPMREIPWINDQIQKFSPRECADCGARFDVITIDNVVMGWSGPAVEFPDASPIYMTQKEAWDSGIRHGMRNPYAE